MTDLNKLIKAVDGVCITTNGYITKHGHGVMGRGVAKFFADKFRHLDLLSQLGFHLQTKGNHVGVLVHVANEGQPLDLIVFPVKTKEQILYSPADLKKYVLPNYWYKFHVFPKTVPGYMLKASPELISRSCEELYQFIRTQHKNYTVALPLPGAGAGGLKPEQSIELLVNSSLTKVGDRIIVFTQDWKMRLKNLSWKLKNGR